MTTTNLFNIEYRKKTERPDPLLVSSPFGKINLEASFDGIMFSKVPPIMIGEISKNSFVYIWNDNDWHFELLRTDVNPKLPKGMNVDRCIGILWRFKNFSKEMSVKLSCCLVPEKRNLEDDYESGEGLISRSWDDTSIRMNIGTEDEDYLLKRAERNKWLPTRLAQENLITTDLIEYLENGIQVTLPIIKKNEEGQVQFVISWVKKKKGDDISTWFAVDVSPDEILQSVNREDHR